jgi:putative nucleotidyltransferase with HDIG domain
VLVKNDLPRHLFPAAVGAMLLIVLVDRSVALAGIVVMALIAGLIRGNDYPMAFSSVMVGGVALLAMKQVQTRVDVMRVGVYLLGIYLALLGAFHLAHFTAEERLLPEMAFASVNAIMSPMLVLGLVIVFENLFGITTDLSLLELVDLNRPLLRELAIKSPGTYHHSIMVGSLAESAAREIGANALLTRAGAYYHDIGKMENREYFIENQETGSRNIHDRLAPVKSAEVVIGHVKKGMELADKHRLPPQVKAFISEHHGRSRLAYFFAKAVNEEGEEIDELRYRYPGPNPQTRETGILMLADTVEAATRSMSEHSIDDMRSTVGKLIRDRIAGGDLEDCPLTFKEIGRIQETFVQVLTGIYHQRIAYPGQEKGVNNSRKGKSVEIPVSVAQSDISTQNQV